MTVTCPHCDKELKNTNGLAIHIGRSHGSEADADAGAASEPEADDETSWEIAITVSDDEMDTARALALLNVGAGHTENTTPEEVIAALVTDAIAEHVADPLVASIVAELRRRAIAQPQ